MIASSPLLIISFIPLTFSADFFFPLDLKTNITAILEQKRGSEDYLTVVDRVISRGILKLSLGLDRATLESSRENVIFSPVSVAGKSTLYLYGVLALFIKYSPSDYHVVFTAFIYDIKLGSDGKVSMSN